MIKLPVRVEHVPGQPGKTRIRKYGQDAGWTVLHCENVEHARQIMADYPAAFMPCWRNPEAVWNKV